MEDVNFFLIFVFIIRRFCPSPQKMNMQFACQLDLVKIEGGRQKKR